MTGTNRPGIGKQMGMHNQTVVVSGRRLVAPSVPIVAQDPWRDSSVLSYLQLYPGGAGGAPVPVDEAPRSAARTDADRRAGLPEMSE